MLWRDICKILSHYLFGLTAALCLPLGLAYYYQFVEEPALHPQPHTTLYFLESVSICFACALFCYWIGRRALGRLYRREALAIVVFIWLLTPGIAALPFYLSGTLENPVQAYFEAASGFTTTGATVMQAKEFDPMTGAEIPIVRAFCGVHTITYSYWGTIAPVRDPVTGGVIHEGVEAVSKALLFWRSLTQWIGGMGIVVLFVAILPLLGVGAKMLYRAEVPGPIKESLTPRIKESSFQLWRIYFGLSALEILALRLVNSEMSWLEIFTVTFSTLSTGGFTVRNHSIGAFNSPATEWVVILFMFLSGVNFSLYFFSLRGKFYRFYEPEFFLYVLSLLMSSCLITALIWFFGNSGYTFFEAVRYGLFQLVSAQTTTGFVTADYELWPYATQAVMLISMYIGGMSASTAGGMKVIRFYMQFRIVQYTVESLFRPETVQRLRIGQLEVDEQAVRMVLCYFFLVISIAVLGTLALVIDGVGPETALSVVSLMINNIGIGFRMASPTESFAFLSNFGLLLSCGLMILGRLEFFAVLALLVPAFWRRTR